MRYRYESDGIIYTVTLEKHGSEYLAQVDGDPYEFEILASQPGQLSLRFEGRPVTVYWANDGSSRWISYDGCTYRLEKPSPRRARRGGEGSLDEHIHAPMPAQVRAVEVAEGDLVEKGQTLLLLEAMKMEIRITAPRAGRVSQLHVQNGQQVDRDQELVEIHPSA